MNSARSFQIRLFGSPCIVAENGTPVTGAVAQRHRLALLALLVLAPGTRATRDRLVGYLWPESEPDRARQLLNQAVYQLRKALGEAAILSTGDELRLNAEVLESDVGLFERALAEGDVAHAVSLCRGPLLDGFFLSDAPEFERWVDRERARLADACAHALETLAEAAEASGEMAGAVDLWKVRAALDPYDSRVARRLMQVMVAVDNLAGALQHANTHVQLLRDEFGIAPPPELEALVQEIRRGRGGTTREPWPYAARDAPYAGADPIAEDAGPHAPGVPGPDAPATVLVTEPMRQHAADSAPARRAAGHAWRWYALAAVVATVLGALTLGVIFRNDDARWLMESAMPRIEAYLDVADWESAYALAREAEARVPGSPLLDELWPRVTWRVSIPSEPAGARVFRQSYAAGDDDWEDLGQTPLIDIRIPYGLSRIRLELPGRRRLLRALGGAHINWQELRPIDPDFLLIGPETYVLDPPDVLPADMVRVPGGTVVIAGDTVQLADFFMGRHEVTNADYRRFVEAGGYRRRELWDAVVMGGDTIPWEEAASRWLDRTGRPGPATWEAGDYPDGEANHPVSGVSWYEAAAYARFAGRELPTAHHWQQALANALFPWLLPASNFNGDGPRSVTAGRAMSHVEAYDLTGNVREWTATAIGSERLVLGGSWQDPYYIAGTTDISAQPEDRSPGNGIRLVLTHDPPGASARLQAPLLARTTVARASGESSVGDAVYAAYSRAFDYDRTPLNAVVEATDTTRVWIRERIRFDAGYANERMLLHLYLPTGRRPPFQTVAFWPGWDTFALNDIDEYFAKQVDFIVKSGRAVAFPVYRGTFERRAGGAARRPDFGTAEYRDNTIHTVKDLRRSLDYLETRSDIDRDAIAFFGYSWGGVNGPVAMAQEPRLRVGIINIGLLPPMSATPEADPLHALPRVRVPTLMFSGEFDPMVPSENARRFFELIGTDSTRKRHVVAIGGHFIPRQIVIRETLDWLDRHLGPVSR